MKWLVFIAVVVTILIAVSCGGTVSGGRVESRAGAVVTKPGMPGAAATWRHLKGDGDDDDTAAELSNPNVKADGDNDKDNDRRDNATKGYNDSDDFAFAAWGQRASLEESVMITHLVRRYFRAARLGQGYAACLMIAVPFARAIPGEYGEAAGPRYARGRTCAKVASAVFGHVHHELSGAVEVTGVRVDGDQARILLGSRIMRAGYIALVREYGSWRIDSLLGGELP
jgi:hypothetical protein